jgi:hypothetical protein
MELPPDPRTISISLSFFQLQETRLKNLPTQGKIGFLNDLLPNSGGLNHAAIIVVKQCFEAMLI